MSPESPDRVVERQGQRLGAARSAPRRRLRYRRCPDHRHRTFGRVSMHGVREELLRAQLDAAGLPAIVVHIPFPCPNEIYEQKMAAAMSDAKQAGITHIVFGDLFLEDVRAYRERQLAGTGITPVFPLWGRPTAALAREMIEAGVEARLSTVDLRKLPASFAGRRFDSALLAALSVRHRPLRRERRIPFFRFGRADALAQDHGQSGGNRRARRICLCGFIASLKLFVVTGLVPVTPLRWVGALRPRSGWPGHRRSKARRPSDGYARP